jgi:integrase/recombinase XerD
VPDLSVVSTTTSASPLARLVDDYLMACRARGLARSTIAGSYGYPLTRVFLPWCDESGLTELSQLTARTMDAFSVHLLEGGGKDGRPLSKATIHAYVRGVRGFLKWCEDEGEGKAARPALPTLPRKVLDVLDRDEIDRLEAAATSERDRIILRILCDCGLRAEELCSLRPESVIRRDRQAHLSVHGKGERDRLVPLPPSLMRRIESYLRNGRPADTRAEELFVGLRRGRSGDYEPLTPSGILQLVARAADHAGIKKRVYTHLLRHSFITNALRSGMSPLLVAKIAGHSSLRMIERVYSHLNTDDAYDAMMEMLAKSSRR